MQVVESQLIQKTKGGNNINGKNIDNKDYIYSVSPFAKYEQWQLQSAWKYSCDISSAKQDYENTILEENDDPFPRTINNKAGLKYIGKIQYIFIGISQLILNRFRLINVGHIQLGANEQIDETKQEERKGQCQILSPE